MRLCQNLLKLPLTHLVIASLLFGLAPFVPEPHLVEKVRMLLALQLRRPLDIFDLCLHGLPVVLLLARVLAGRLCEKKAQR